jgi:uncharacterized protein (TIGR02001 family)
MKFSKTLLAASCAAAAFVSPAFAQEAPALAITGNIGVFSDYVYRGVTQTDGKAAVQGGLDASYGIFYAGVWSSNVDFNVPGVNQEIDVYAGLKPVTGPITWDLGVVYYGYVEDKLDFPFTEFKVAPSIALENGASVGLNVFYSPEFFGKTGQAWYYEGVGSVPFGKAGPFAVNGYAAIGYQDVEKSPSYTTWKLGVTGALDSGVALDLMYSDTDEDFGGLGGSRVTLSLKYTGSFTK